MKRSSGKVKMQGSKSRDLANPSHNMMPVVCLQSHSAGQSRAAQSEFEGEGIDSVAPIGCFQQV